VRVALYLIFAALASWPVGCGDDDDSSTADDADRRARGLVAQMTLEQKISQTHGDAPPEDFRVVLGIPELGIPDLTVTNGPAGVGPGPEILGNVPATALPSPLLLASTWDPEMARRYGDVQGIEMRAIGRNLLEAPDVDLARTPLNGRTFEAYGEDPYLVSRLGVANIEAIQSHGILAMVKHYTANNQERDRNSIDARVDERTLRELYLPPFEAAVREAEVASVMCSYNSVNGAFSCENRTILTDILKGEWGFRGFVQSDFFAMQSTVSSADAGTDLEMPSGRYFAEPLIEAVRNRDVAESRIDDMLIRRYREMIRFGLFEREPGTSPIPAEEHAAIAREIAAAGTVLLRNRNGVLPLDESSIDSVAVVGPWAHRAATGGGGSSMVDPIRTITPFDAIVERLAGTAVEVLGDAEADFDDSVALAAAADVAVVIVGDFETEGTDRTTLALPAGQDELVEAVAAVNPRTVVVLHAGAPVLMPWNERVAAIVEGWYPGGEDGTVTAAVLFGDVNPSGKLPITLPATDGQGPTNTPERYPGVDGVVYYDEGLLVGYRWYDATGEVPLYPFGFGLSYTSFALDGLELSDDTVEPGQSFRVAVGVENTGERGGAEVVQVYVAYPPEASEPPKQLRAFQRVELAPGESRRIEMELGERALAIWDTPSGDWLVGPGAYQIMVGTSSVDTPLRATVQVR
jgi:beta-glucosidase